MMESSIANVQGKTILITGGAQGIGGATARLCAERGAIVIITDIKVETGEALAADLQAAGKKATFQKLDVRKQEEVQRVFEEVTTTHGSLDVLICAAGVLEGALLQPEEFPVETFDFVMEVNVRGTFLCVKYATPLLVQSGNGVILLVGSGAGVRGGSSSIAYGTSKGAVNGMGMTLEGHLASRGIRVNVICPGGIETELKLNQLRTVAERQGRTFDSAEAAQRLGSPVGIAKLLAYLASDDGDYVRRNLFTR